MNLVFTIQDFLTWQLEHYAQRLINARSTEERAFLRAELYRLKRANHDSE